MVLHGEQDLLPQRLRMIVAGRRQLIAQHVRFLISQGFKRGTDDGDFISPTGKHWIVATWQAAAKNPNRYLRHIPHGFLYVDEVHLGGSHAKNKSFRRIVVGLQPRKRIYVSATTYVVSEALLGPREGHTFHYSMQDAYQAKLLNPALVIEIETGISAILAKIEVALGKDIEEIEQYTDESLPKLALKMQAMSVVIPQDFRSPSGTIEVAATEAAKRIIQYQAEAMIDLYVENHEGEPAIFWCGNIDAADRAADHFRTRSNVACASVHSHSGNQDDLITDFEQGRIVVIFAVGMLQEGFNFPKLTYGFCCRFSGNLAGVEGRKRIARQMHRIGRLTRKSHHKKVSRYYVATNLMHYYNKYHIPRGTLLAAHTFAHANNLLIGDEVPIPAGEELVLNTSDPNIEGLEVAQPSARAKPLAITDKKPLRRIKVHAAPLYSIVDVDGSREVQSISLLTLFADDMEMAKADWLRRAMAGEKQPSGKSKEGRSLYHARTRDPVFDKRLTEAEWTIKHMSSPRAMVALKAEWERSARAGEKQPSGKSKEGHRLYAARKNDPDFDKRLTEAGVPIRPIISRASIAAFIADCEQRAKAGETPPKPKSIEGKRLNDARNRDPNLDKRLTDSGWERGIKIRAMAALKADWEQQAKAGENPPTGKEAQQLYGVRKRDPDFDQRLNEAGWVRVRVRNRYKKNAITG